MKKAWVLAALALLLAITGCARRDAAEQGRIERVDMESELLHKTITSFVYLPYGYDPAQQYPTLYFMASAGGSAYTVINQFGIATAADALMSQGKMPPMVIVALGIDFSFGLNSAAEPGSKTFESEQVYTFQEGLYEDYIVNEAIPYIDAHYATNSKQEYRFIGGYSMGGFAALHIGFRHPDLFSKIGGHSPTLFLDTYVTPEIDAWLFPTAEERAMRDPMLLAENANLQGVQVYLDTGTADVNREACEALALKLTNRGVDASFTPLSGSHGFAYCSGHMQEYLLFYAGTKPE